MIAEIDVQGLVAKNPSSRVEIFRRYGVVLVPNIIDLSVIDTFINELHELIVLRLRNLGVEPSDDLDIDFNVLCETDDSRGGGIYDAARTLSGFYALIRLPVLLDIINSLLSPELLQMPFGPCQFRIDRPNVGKYLLDWHQDYTYNLMGTNAVTAWLPLRDIDHEMGPMQIVVDTDRRIKRVRRRVESWQSGEGGGGKVFEYPDLDANDLEAKAIEIPVKAGDVLFFDALVMHRSSMNQSQKSRWVVNPRYGDISIPEIVQRDYLCGHKPQVGFRDVFDLIHPELS